jgi:glycosyltransferase involved in cell wall biosynthesis
MRTRTLFLLDQLNFAGAQKRAFNIARSLDPDRFEVQIISLEAGGPLAAHIEAAGIELTVLTFNPSPRRVLHNLIQLLHLTRIIRQRAPAIVHTFSYWSTVYGSIASVLARTPIVITSRTSQYNLKPQGRVFRLIERITNSLATAVVTISKAVRKDTIEMEGVPERKVEFIYNGVELGPVSDAPRAAVRDSLGLAPTSPVVVMVANFHSYKRHETVIRAIPATLSIHPDTQFLMVGRVSGQIDALKQMADDLGVANAVRWPGLRTDIPDILDVCDIGILCSETEALGNAILEFMDAGLPVIGTTVGGIPEIIVDGETGYLFSVGDEVALAKHLIHLLSNPEQASQMGAAGRARVREHFSCTAMVTGYTRLYESCLRDKNLA